MSEVPLYVFPGYPGNPRGEGVSDERGTPVPGVDRNRATRFEPANRLKPANFVWAANIRHCTSDVCLSVSGKPWQGVHGSGSHHFENNSWGEINFYPDCNHVDSPEGIQKQLRRFQS